MSEQLFLSFVGTQYGGVLQPLEACLSAGKNFDAIWLCSTQKTRESAERIEEYCVQKGYPPVCILPYDPRQPGAEMDIVEKTGGATIFFNVEGGLNFAVSRMLLQLGDKCAYLLAADTDHLLCHRLADGTREKLSLPPALPVAEILRLQGVAWEGTQLPLSLCSLCRKLGVSLPANRLENVRIGNVDFDLVWNDGRNKLCFLTNFYRERMENKALLAAIRGICQWAATRTASGQLYDRQTFVLCPTRESQEHLAEESRRKIKAVYLPVEWLPRRAPDELRRMFQPASALPEGKGSRKVPSDTLVLMLGTDAAPTLNAVESGLTHLAVRHVILCHTADEAMRERARRLRERFAASAPGCDMKTLETGLNGSRLPQQLVAEDGAQGIHVNITPGTKGQTAFLTLWAQRNKAAVWSLNPPSVTRLDAEAASLPITACDPLLLLQTRYPDVRVEGDTSDQALYEGLLHHMRACLESGQEWSLQKDRTVNGMSLKRTGFKNWMLSLPSGEKHTFSEAGGDWLEGLTAYSLSLMGAQHVHARVRLPWSEELQLFLEKKFQEEQHRLDVDVIAAWKGGHLLVSCKANPTIPIPDAAAEARDMAHALARFALPALCHLGCRESYLADTGNEEKVPVFGWRDLCRPERLATLFAEALRSRRSTV